MTTTKAKCDCGCGVTVRTAGRSTAYDGETWVQWAVFERAEVEGQVDMSDPDEVAAFLTGWREYGGSPGRAFWSEPHVRMYRHAILVYQRGGLDV